MHDDHDDHDHDHGHAPPQKDHDAGPMGAYEVLEEAVRSLLIEKGVLTAQEIAAQVDVMDSRSPALGAKVVARAWTDAAFKKRLLSDTRAALAEIGIDIGTLAEFRVVENTREGAQRHRLHAVLLLPQDAARHPAGLVQEPRLPLAHRRRPARRARRVRRASCRPTWRCGCTIPPPICATSCCRCGPRPPRAGASSSSPPSSRATA